MINEVEGFIIDLDGTVFRGKKLIPGVDKALASLRATGKKMVFVSNRGNISRQMCYDKLKGLGIEVQEEEIILASTVTAYFLRENHPGCSVWTLGDQGLRDELAVYGIEHATTPKAADFLVISLHETLTYHDLNLAFRAVHSGARMIATNADKTYPTENGLAMDVAGMIGAIEAATDQKVEHVFGKPSHLMVEAALNQLQLSPEKCMMIGDSINSDIMMGNTHLMKTLLVLTGNTKKSDVEGLVGMTKPDYILDSLSDIMNDSLVYIGV